MLQRAQKTWKNIAEKLNENNIPIVKTWQLNERHYGALQGFIIILMNNNFRT